MKMQTLIWDISVEEMTWPSQYLCKLEPLKIFVRNVLRKERENFGVQQDENQINLALEAGNVWNMAPEAIMVEKLGEPTKQ